MGYEGLNSQQFFHILRENGVQTIVDVRELPLSRKAGFSKASLSQIALSYKINYIHIPSLGCPSEIRHGYKKDRNWEKYTYQYLQFLNNKQTALLELSNIIKNANCCLVCFEADANYCHRIYIAEKVSTIYNGRINITHLRMIIPTKAERPILVPV